VFISEIDFANLETSCLPSQPDLDNLSLYTLVVVGKNSCRIQESEAC
jgi:hypothetical protein